MVTVMIVDDEILVRVGLKSCLDWEKHGFEVIAQAEDGVSALKQIKKRQPDILLTDIKMPNMDGLELIKIIREQYPDMKIIVLSCYNEIDYVKEAIRMGAEDYLLKLSLEPGTLLRVMNRAKEAVVKSEKDGQKPGVYGSEIKTNRNIIKDSIYRTFTDGLITAGEFNDELRSLGVDLDFSNYFVVCCGMDTHGRTQFKKTQKDSHLLRCSFRNIAEEIFSNYCRFDIAETANGNFIIIAQTSNYCVLDEIFRQLNNATKKYLNITVSFGISSECSGINDLRDKYREACCALQNRFYCGRESITQYDGIHNFVSGDIFMDYEDECMLLNALENMDTAGALSITDGFLDGIAAGWKYTPESVRHAVAEVAHALSKTAKKYKLQDSINNAGFGQIIPNTSKIETLSEIKELLRQYIVCLVNLLSEAKLKYHRPEIARVKSYIAEHTDENITLDKAAEISGLSKCYFSTVFKKEVGETFTDYLNKVKMEKARELILDYRLRSYEAAERVGIRDESYFSKLFKKYIGESPSRIRR